MTIAAAAVRREPRHDSELRNQLLLGEVVRILRPGPGGQWLRVRGREDGYAGWTRAWGLRVVAPEEAERWRKAATARIRTLLEVVTGAKAPGEVLGPVCFGSRLAPIRVSGSRVRVRLPDGRIGRVPRRAIRLAGDPAPSLAARMRSLAGIPYLWGGRTPAGLDCSGFTQLVLDEQGIAIPRDSREQFSSSRPLARAESPRPGDLVFFGRPREPVSHVGIISNRGTFVHCRGCVQVGSLDQASPLYEKELMAQFRGIRRP